MSCATPRVATDADLILVDHALSPSQERNLEKHTGRRVLDRNGLILDIFAQRARSFEGKLEVELAQLKHMASRLVRGWTHLERQKGGIGMRGPGETQLETDRRLLGQRVKVLRQAPGAHPAAARDRAARAHADPVPTLALVGYTNAGKSTLFRALTGATAYVADQLFATLDPTVRRIRLPGGTPAVVADTVGFIRDLPHELVAAFRRRYRGARGTVLLHVVDASDPRRDERMEQVDEVLEEIGAGEIPQILVYNKIDRLGRLRASSAMRDGRVSSVWISAAQAQRARSAAQAITERLSRARCRSRGCGCRPAPGRCAPGCTRAASCARSASWRTGRSSCAWSCRTWSCWSWPAAPGVVILESSSARLALYARRAGTYNRRLLRARPSCR